MPQVFTFHYSSISLMAASNLNHPSTYPVIIAVCIAVCGALLAGIVMIWKYGMRKQTSPLVRRFSRSPILPCQCAESTPPLEKPPPAKRARAATTTSTILDIGTGTIHTLSRIPTKLSSSLQFASKKCSMENSSSSSLSVSFPPLVYDPTSDILKSPPLEQYRDPFALRSSMV